MAKNIEVTLVLNDKGFTRKAQSAKQSIAGLGGASKSGGAGLLALGARFAPLAAGIGGVVAAFKGLSASVSTASQFQDIETVLTNLTGSAAKGKAALNQLIEVATELPLSFEELAAAQPALATISPTLKDLENNTRLAADIAGNFGISFTDAASQLQRAFAGGAGAADIFRERGVLAAAGFEAGVSYSIEETQEKLREFGGSIEGAAQNLNNTLGGALSQVGDKFTLFKKSVGDAILPEFQGFLTALNNVLVENGSNLAELGNTIGSSVVTGFKAAGQAIAFTIDLILTMRDTFLKVFDALFPNFGEFWDGFLKLGREALTWLINKLIDFGESFGELLDYIPGVGSGMADFFGALREDFNSADGGLSNLAASFSKNYGDIIVTNRTARDALSGFFNDLDATADRLRKANADAAAAAKEVTGEAVVAIAQNAASSTETFTEVFKKLKEEFEDVDSFELYEAQLGKLQEMLNSGAITLKQYKEAKEALDNVFMENNELYASFGKAIEGIAGGITSSLTDAIMEGESLLDGLKDTFKRAISQMIADSLRLQIIQPLLQGIFGGSFGPGGYTPGGTGLLGNFFQGIFGRASGGPIMKGRPYVVGERGPEVIVPDMPGNVVPNNALGGGAVTYNINAVDARSFKQLVAEDPQFIYNVTRVGQRRQPT